MNEINTKKVLTWLQGAVGRVREFAYAEPPAPPREQERVVQLLVERIEYDGSKNKVTITFQPTGIQTLANELAQRQTKGKTA